MGGASISLGSFYGSASAYVVYTRATKDAANRPCPSPTTALPPAALSPQHSDNGWQSASLGAIPRGMAVAGTTSASRPPLRRCFRWSANLSQRQFREYALVRSAKPLPLSCHG